MRQYARFTCVLSILSIVFVVVLTETETDKENQDECAVFYKKGVDAYLANQFPECVENLEEALKKYHAYSRALQNCRLKCNEEAELSDPLYPVDVDNLYFYEKTLKNTLCIIKCRKSNLHTAAASTLSAETVELFEDQKPYQYLHLCYFQTKQPQKAASAAFTYLVSHPKDDAMIHTLKYYSNQEGVDMNEVINFEAKSEEECRALCEGPFVQGWYPDFIPSIANHFTFCLKCKKKCQEKLNNLNGEYHEDLLPSHYHYLQYAYFKSGNLKAACQAAASYVLFYPDDETMRSNLEYYKKLPKVEANYFTPRPEAVHYVRRYTYEGRLLKYVQTEYNFSPVKSESPTITDEPPKEQPSSVDEQNPSLDNL